MDSFFNDALLMSAMSNSNMLNELFAAANMNAV